PPVQAVAQRRRVAERRFELALRGIKQLPQGRPSFFVCGRFVEGCLRSAFGVAVGAWFVRHSIFSASNCRRADNPRRLWLKAVLKGLPSNSAISLNSRLP